MFENKNIFMKTFSSEQRSFLCLICSSNLMIYWLSREIEITVVFLISS